MKGDIHAKGSDLMGKCPICREDTVEIKEYINKHLGYRKMCYNCKWQGYTNEPQCDEGFFEYMDEVT